jgi:Tc toxin complex TcA C-terminal TcB-binding domain/Neuraminidase-like domain/Salmonella virulence plasmid 28.1kDa A protein
MTTDAVAAATNGSGIPPLAASRGLAGGGIAPPPHGSGQSGNLVEPQLLYTTTAQAAANPVVAQRLGERLADEVRRLLGAVSNPLELAVLAAVRAVRWQDIRERSVAEFAAAVLAQVTRDPHLASEASTARMRVMPSPSRTVADVLALDAPLIDNPAMHTDVTRGLVAEFARLAGLSDAATQAVTQHSEALVNSSGATLDALVTQGRLTGQEHASLTTILDLAKLTDDNLVLIRAVLATGVTSPLSLVGWTTDHWQQLIGAQQIPVPPGETPTSYAQAIVHNLDTTYPAHALAAHVEDGHLATVLARNPGLDVRTADLVGGGAAQLDWSGIPAEARGRVENELRSYQRLIPLADSTADRLALKRAGYDSALVIAGQPEEEFVATSGLDEGRARLIFARAHSAAASVAQHHAGVHHLLKTGFTNLPAANAAALADELRQVGGMNELFGSQDFCDCDDCHSVLSPAAYFVDLMHFLDTNVSAPHFKGPGGADHPLHLRHRRPDLWKLQLTPNNTSTLLPYLSIVNEVLETYLDHAGHVDIYQTLNNPSVKVSFRVPFSLPFAELGLYLAHFAITPADVYRTLRLPAAQVHRAQLGLAPSEAIVITSPDPPGVLSRLGHPGERGDYHLLDFLRVTGLQRDQLDALLASRFHPDLGAITVTAEADPGELQNFPQLLTNLTPARLDFIHRFIRLWRATSWQIADYDLILAAGVEARITGRELDDRTIEFLARLTKLQTSLRLQPEELGALIADMAVSAAYPRGAPPAQQRLYERVFDPQKLFAPVDTDDDSPAGAQPDQPPSVPRPTQAGPAPHPGSEQPVAPEPKTSVTAGEPGPAAASPSTEQTRASHQPVQRHPTPSTSPPAVAFHHSTFNNTDPGDTRTDPRAPLLLSSLQISETDLEALLTLLAAEVGFDKNGDGQIDRHRLSLMYRHTRLAAALKLSVADLAEALSLLFDPAERVLTTLDQVEQLLAFITWQRASAFTIAELRFMLAGVTDGPIQFTNTDQSTALLVQQAQAAHAADPRDALRDRLALTFNVPTARLADLLAWVPADINGPTIRAAATTVIAADGTPTSPGDLVPLTDLAQQLERVILLFSKLKLDDANLNYLTNHRDALGITTPTALTVHDARSIAVYSTMVTADSTAPATTQDMLAALGPGSPHGAAPRQISPGSPHGAAERHIAGLWRVGHGLPAALRKVLPAARTPIEALQQLHDAATLCTTLGISAYALASLGRDASFGELTHARNIALGAVTANYPDATKREQILQPLSDRVNILKRDALCDYIMGWGAALNFHSHSDLYDFFLIDPDMGSCFQTSRVVSALSTLQLYAERCRQGLEQTRRDAPKHIAPVSIPPGAIPADQWEWRKNFRVWQANRKVFLYPESYIDPDLLDIKTPLFEELEDELLQQKITTDSASDAYLRYLTQFAELAHLRIAGSCYHHRETEAETDTYYFFGCTHQDPPVYYWRSWDRITWSPWHKIDLAIDAPTVSAEFHLGRLYLFWVDTKSKDKTSIKGGDSQLEYCEVTISLQYSALQPSGKWLPAQKLDSLRPLQTAPGQWNNRLYPVVPHGLFDTQFMTELMDLQRAGADLTHTDMTTLILQQMEGTKTYRRVYPNVVGDSIVLRYLTGYLPAPAITDRELDLFHNKLRSRGHLAGLHAAPAVLLFPEQGHKARLGITTVGYPSEPEFDLALEQLPLTILKAPPKAPPHIYITEKFDHHPAAADEAHADHILNLVHNRYPESILTFNGQQYLIHEVPIAQTHGAPAHGGHHPPAHHGAAHPAHHGAAQPGAHHPAAASHHGAGGHKAKAHHAAHATSISHAAQAHTGAVRRQLVRLSTSTADHLGEVLMRDGLDEFFTLDTQKTHEKPVGFKITTSAELLYPADNPHHLDFNGAMGVYYREMYLHIPWLIARALRADGKHQDALSWYRRICDFTAEDSKHDKPGERPWRYIEFRDLTLPKLKATLTDHAAIAAYEADPFNPHAIARLRPSAYQRAIVMDIIGTYYDLGDSLFAQDTMESVNEASLYYTRAAEMLGPRPTRLGKCHTVPDTELTYEKLGPAVGKGSELLLMLENWAYANHAATSVPIHLHAPTKHPATAPTVAPYRAAAAGNAQHIELAAAVKSGSVAVPTRHAPAVPAVLHSTLAFCIPPNDELLSLYDQVEDRLFKIRNCMNISGVRRQLALFAPPIDPMALVRARAAGLSLEDALAALAAPVPPYRFTHLIDRARQAASTAQAFGGALLSALEKKDVEELTLLRSLHERQVLRMTKEVKTQQLKEAQHQAQAMVETVTNVQNRIDHYTDLISSGLTAWEHTEEISRYTATIAHSISAVVQMAAAIAKAAPQGGSPFAMTYGGIQLGGAASAFAATADTLGSVAEAVAASAGLEAGWQRREQDWRQQLLLAQQELKQVQQQCFAADTRAAIAEKELDIHETSMDQAAELDEFYKNKFSRLGLYNYLATTLTRLHHTAYHVAEELALMTQRAYQFERDDDTIFIAPDNWQADHAGLLAGERLTLQLQQLDNAYLAKNTRQLDVTQSFSLALVDPNALLTLRETGSCEFTLPEVLFDLAYPGQYKRIITAARLSIPAVAGPYSNLGATLTLKNSWIRTTPSTDPAALIPQQVPATPPDHVATSTGVNDSGTADPTDGRYLPFEGAGAISTWGLTLPTKLRLFDYTAIPDIVLQVSYRALDDGAFRDAVETALLDTLTSYATTTGIYRLFSLRHDFPDAYAKLRTAAGTKQTTQIDIAATHFPFFLSSQQVVASSMSILLRPKATDPIDTNGLALTVNGAHNSTWSTPPDTKLRSADFAVSGPGIATWKIAVTTGHLDPANLDDLFILLKYKLQ